MSKYQEIEKKLLEIDGALFQNVCDAVLYYTEQDYPNIFRSGSQTGKVKTVKGTPDTFFMLPNNKYILVEYTTQSSENKKKFIQKVKKDLDKCLDESITGITCKDIDKIIYCSNSSLSLNEAKELTDYCRSKGVRLDFKGIHTIARILTGRCSSVAKEFLSVAIDTGQILRPESFMEEYAASGLATILTNEFMHREVEISDLVNSINSANKITVVTGPPGVGKTKLAMEAVKAVNKQGKNYEVYCITNKNANLHDDLRTYLSGDKDYLILVDDANRQSDHLQSVLHLLNEKRLFRIHIIITVRDYAFQDITSRCKGYDTNIVEIGRFKDEELTAILKSADFNITQEAIDRVLDISNGNPRLAIMATKVALDANNLGALSDVSDIYDLYFQGAIGNDNVFRDKDLLKTLGLLCFFFSLNLEDTDFINQLTSRFHIDIYKFKDALIELERLELAETTSDFSMIKISDQVLATYFFYKTFIADQVLDFRLILKHYFTTHLRRIKDSIIPANNTFTYNKVYPVIDPILTEFWLEISSIKDRAFEFLNLFWFYRPDDTFAFVADKISLIEKPTSQNYIYDPKPNHFSSNQDEYLKLLSNFFTQPIPEVHTAIDLSFEYVQCVPQSYTQLINTIRSSFIFRYEDESQSHMRQLALWNLVVSKAQRNQSIFVQAFFDLGPDLMKASFHVTASGRKANTIAMYSFKVRLMDGVMKFRTITWQFLQATFDSYQMEAIGFLLKYLERTPDKVKDVYEFDLTFLLTLFDSHFSNESFAHCFIVRDLIYWFKRVGINHERFDNLKEHYTNETYRYYVVLSWDRLRDKFDYNYQYDSYDKYDRIKRIEIKRAFVFADLRDFERFYSIFLQVYSWKKNDIYQFNKSLSIILGHVFEKSPSLCLLVLKYIIRDGNKSGVVPHDIYRLMWTQSQFARTLFPELLKGEFLNKTSWILDYLSFSPIEYLETKHINTLILTFNTSTDLIYFNTNLIHKLIPLRPSLYKELFEIVVKKIEQGQKNFMIDQHAFKHDIGLIGDILLVKKAYFQQDQLNQHFDYNFEGFLEILKLDRDFLLEYLSGIVHVGLGVHSSDYSHFHVIWELEDADLLAVQALDFLVSQELFVIDDSFANVFFQGIKAEHLPRAEAFLFRYLKDNVFDTDKVDMVMNVARHSFKALEDEFIMRFLSDNSDFERFKQVQWLSNYFMGNGDTIWADVKAQRLEEMLRIFDRITDKPYRYAKHKNYLKDRINAEKRSADFERKHIFMYGD